MSLPLPCGPTRAALLAQAIESDRTYFELAAEVGRLAGATLAGVPGLAHSPAGAVVHRVDPDAIADGGAAWIGMAETAMAGIGAGLYRIYLDGPDERADAVLRAAGYVARDELVFLDCLPNPSLDVMLRPVASGIDWAAKLHFHEAADRTPDGHGNGTADWVELERRKCRAGMNAYLAELDGEVVGAVGAIWCGDFVRTKNLLVAPGSRRRGIARAMIGRLAVLGRQRGVSKQCFLAVGGEQGEQLYRSMGMAMIGMQVEWSKPLGECA